MTFNYDKANATAKKIINKYGGAGSLIKKGTTGGFDSGGNTKPDSPDVAIDGIITPLVKYKSNEIDGETIIKGDSWVFFQSASLVEIDMQTTINNKTFSVKGIETLSSISDINIFQRLHLRK